MEMDDTVERQRQIAAESLRRHRAIGASPAPVTGDTINQTASAADATSTTPRDFGHALTSAPDGRGGAALTFEEIMRSSGR